MKKLMVIFMLLLVSTTGCTFKVKELEKEAASVEKTADEKAVNFKLSETESLLDETEKNTLLVFWATWCPSCLIELPKIQKLYEENNENLRIITVNLTSYEKNGKEEVNKFLKDNKYTFPVYYDDKNEISDLYKVRYIPENYLISKEGTVILHINEFDESKIKEKIK